MVKKAANKTKFKVDKTLNHYVVCEVNSVTCKTVFSPERPDYISRKLASNSTPCGYVCLHV